MEIRRKNLDGDTFEFNTDDILNSIAHFGYGVYEFHTSEIEAIIKKLESLQSENTALKEQVKNWKNNCDDSDEIINELKKENKQLEEILQNTLGTYNTPAFFEYLTVEKIDMVKECKDKGVRSFLLMFIGFYKSWLKKENPEINKLLNKETNYPICCGKEMSFNFGTPKKPQHWICLKCKKEIVHQYSDKRFKSPNPSEWCQKKINNLSK